MTRVSHEVTRLIDRLRKLVAEQRRLDGDASSELREANLLEIDRLQWRLAAVVRCELASAGLMHAGR